MKWRSFVVIGFLLAPGSLSGQNATLGTAISDAIRGEAGVQRSSRGEIFLDSATINATMRGAALPSLSSEDLVSLFPSRKVSLVPAKTPAVVQGLRDGALYIALQGAGDQSDV